MASLAHIADRVLNAPLAIMPEKLAIIAGVLGGRIGIDAVDLTPRASRFAGSTTRGGRRLPYAMTEDGVAVLPIIGSLVHRGAWIGASSGLISYEGLQAQLNFAARDPQCGAILIDIESAGGEVIGSVETAAVIRKLSAEKPVFAIANSMAASAGYLLASAARAVVVTPSALVGSIGICMLHADHSRALDAQGVTPTFIHAGAHKVDGNQFEPLSTEVRADLQAEVEKFQTLLVEAVAAGRGARLTALAARATEAKTYIGKAAVDAGLADRVGSFEDVLAEVTKISKRATARTKGTSR